MEAAWEKTCNLAKPVDLDRYLYEFTQKELEDPEVLARYNEDYSWSQSLAWAELLEKKRVVFLASAGSGKTHEMRQQQERLSAAKKAAFYVPLEELAKSRFEDLLLPTDQEAFGKWKSGSEPAWFFLDAVDELKLVRGKLRDALRKLRQAVDGQLQRTHIIVSSRPSDWKIPSDEATFLELLPIPDAVEKNEEISEEMFLDAVKKHDRGSLSNERMKVPNKRVHTALLLPLADRHVRKFAQERGVSDSELFLKEIDRQNAWIFARRPLDLLDLINLWNRNGKIGTRCEQHANNVLSKLKDDPEREDAGLLSEDDLQTGAEKIALAVALTRRRTIKIPDLGTVYDSQESCIETAEVFRDWSVQKRASLLRRAVFDPATFGRVRFHHRSVQEYLAACRLNHLRAKGMSVKALLRLLVGDKYGERVAIPSMRPVAAWLALWDSDVRREIISREPEVLLENGDPASFGPPIRSKIIREFVRNFGAGGWRGLSISNEQIERIAHPELAGVIQECWATGPSNPEVRDFLLDLIWKGKLLACKDIASEVALSPTEPVGHRATAVRALVACSASEDLQKVTANLLSNQENWPHDLVGGVLSELFPSHLDICDVINLIERPDVKTRNSSFNAYRWPLERIVEAPTCPLDRKQLRRRLTELVIRGAEVAGWWRNIPSKYGALCPVIAQLCLKEIETLQEDEIDPCLIRSCLVAYYLGGEDRIDKFRELLRKSFEERILWRNVAFWEQVALADALLQNKDSWSRFFANIHQSLTGDVRASDKLWLELVLNDPEQSEKHQIALEALIRIWRFEGADRSRLEALKIQIGGNTDLLNILQKRTQKVATSRKTRQWEAESRRSEIKRKRKEAARLSGWKKWRTDIIKDPAPFFSQDKQAWTIRNLFLTLNRHVNSGSSYGLWSYDFLVKLFGKPVADLSREAFKNEWRKWSPQLRGERPEGERNSTPYDWVYGLCGVMAEAEENPEWTQRLTDEDAKLAVRYATVEINGFARFISDLAKFKPHVVDEVLGGALTNELSLSGTLSYLPILQDLTHADKSVKALLAHRLVEFLQTSGSLVTNESSTHWASNLRQIFDILDDTLTETGRFELASLCALRFGDDPFGILHLTWLEGLFRFDAERAASVLIDSYESDPDAERVIRAFSTLFGSWQSVGLRIADHDSRARVLGALVRCIYRNAPFEPPSEDDEIQAKPFCDSGRARSLLLSLLIETPGFLAQQILSDLANEPEFGHIPDRLRHLARERAAKDAEFEAWTVAEVGELEDKLDTIPSDRDSLFRVMMDCLEDLQHNVLHDDFTDRRTIATITKEREMQKRIAGAMRELLKGTCTVHREEHVADDMEPDIHLHSRRNDTKVAIEIKIADNRWSLKDLEEALRNQLTKKYLRHESCKGGCLLLTYNGEQKKWAAGMGRPSLSFEGLIKHLNKLAESIEKEHKDKIKLAVFGLDLTGSYLTVTVT